MLLLDSEFASFADVAEAWSRHERDVDGADLRLRLLVSAFWRGQLACGMLGKKLDDCTGKPNQPMKLREGVTEEHLRQAEAILGRPMPNGGFGRASNVREELGLTDKQVQTILLALATRQPSTPEFEPIDRQDMFRLDDAYEPTEDRYAAKARRDLSEYSRDEKLVIRFLAVRHGEFARWYQSREGAAPPFWVLAAKAEGGREKVGIVPSKSKPGAKGYAEDDAPLIEEMISLTKDRAFSAWNAALAVADRAKGGGTLEAKAKRLLKRFQKMQMAEKTEPN